MTENIPMSKLARLPKATLEEAASDMPDLESATKPQIAEWLAENQPEKAQALLSDDSGDEDTDDDSGDEDTQEDSDK